MNTMLHSPLGLATPPSLFPFVNPPPIPPLLSPLLFTLARHLMPCSLTQRPLLARSGSSITPNAFVETTLSYALTYISRAARQRASHSMKSARLSILADNDYYSQPSSTTSSSATTSTSSPSTSSSATTL